MIRAAALAIITATPALAVERFNVRQEFGPVQGQHHSAAAPVDDFFGLGFTHGPAFIDFDTGANGVQNPLYQEQTHQGENPLYNEGDRGNDIVSAISSLTWDFGAITIDTMPRDNIVHRDIAVRNLILTTDFGTFRSLVGEEFTFGVDAPAENYFSAGPVTWVSTASIRLYLDGDAGSTEFIDFQGTWFTDTLVPAPGATMLFGLGACATTRRRR